MCSEEKKIKKEDADKTEHQDVQTKDEAEKLNDSPVDQTSVDENKSGTSEGEENQSTILEEDYDFKKSELKSNPHQVLLKMCTNIYDKQLEFFSSFRTRLYTILTVIVAVLTIVYANFEYEKLYRNLDTPIIILTTIFVTLNIIAFLTIIYSVYKLLKSSDSKEIAAMDIPHYTDLLNYHFTYGKEDFPSNFYTDICEKVKECNESVMKENRNRMADVKIYGKKVLFGILVLLISYVALRIVVNI